MLALFSLLGASALVPFLCPGTGATPITSVPELRDDELLFRPVGPGGPPCSQDLPYGHGPNSTVDTALGFATNLAYSLAAQTPSNLFAPGYVLVDSNKAAAAQKAGVWTMRWNNMATYDVAGCASQCTATTGCKAFNIYFQRSPTVAPSFDSSCPNPPAQCHIVCQLYNGTLAAADMTNAGEMRSLFKVVIAGSNVFNKVSAV